MIYENYAKIRDSKNMKDFDVSKATGIGSSTFSDWKAGRSKPKQEKLTKIADALGVTYSELIGLSETKNAPVPEFEPEHIQLISLFSQLNEAEKNIILGTMKAFISGHTQRQT